MMYESLKKGTWIKNDGSNMMVMNLQSFFWAATNENLMKMIRSSWTIDAPIFELDDWETWSC